MDVKIKELRESYEQQEQSSSIVDDCSANTSTTNELEALACIISLNKQDYETFKSKFF
jgi:hypothetical protein